MVKRNSYNRTTNRHTCTCAEVKGVIQVSHWYSVYASGLNSW